MDLGRGHHDAKDAPRVWPDALPLCRLPRARPNLTKPVTALLPSYVPICAKQIWMENSSGRRQESQEYRIHLWWYCQNVGTLKDFKSIFC